ncbi:hypothetical protein GGR55DRAFT_675007 [Xylaria sp. FL0064]|nr:hypothetical protein GGR55DRAFT_675007 [Xylaria sp. FL0064]
MFAMFRFGLLVALYFFYPCQADEVTCYAPDGTAIADNQTAVPCNKLGITQANVHSSCCRLGGEADERDLCTTTGLCINSGVVRREFCTDSTWKSPACVNVCTDPKSGGSASGIIELTACLDGTGTYCCGHNNLTCCGSDYAIVIPTQASIVETDSAALAKPGAFKSATIALAIILGLVLLAAALALFWRLKFLKFSNQQTVEDFDAATQASLTTEGLHQYGPYPKPSSGEAAPGPISSGSHENNSAGTSIPLSDARSPASRSEIASPTPPGNYASLSSVMESPQLPDAGHDANSAQAREEAKHYEGYWEGGVLAGS